MKFYLDKIEQVKTENETTPAMHCYNTGLGSSPVARHYWGNHCYFLFLAKKYGNAVSVIPCQEAMMVSQDDSSAVMSYPRSQLKRTQTPQAMRYGPFIKMHEKALSMGITSSVATCTLIIETGGVVHYSLGSEKNIKLTTPEDLDIFKALLKVESEH